MKRLETLIVLLGGKLQEYWSHLRVFMSKYLLEGTLKEITITKNALISIFDFCPSLNSCLLVWVSVLNSTWHSSFFCFNWYLLRME